jgi:hypothetical protein
MNLINAILKVIAIKFFPPVERLVNQRDLLIFQNNELINKKVDSPLDFYPKINWPYEICFAKIKSNNNHNLAERLCQSYRMQISLFEGFGTSFWKQYSEEKNKTLHDALMSDDINHVAAVLSNPSVSNLFMGMNPS